MHHDTTDRPIAPSLTRTVQTRLPRGLNYSNENEAGIDRRGPLDRDLIPPDFIQSHHTEKLSHPFFQNCASYSVANVDPNGATL
jgi:hypothetical protein